MSAPLNTVFEHVMATLPDSIREQKRVLKAVRSLITSKHPGFSRITALLEHIEHHEKLQTELPLAFKEGGVK